MTAWNKKQGGVDSGNGNERGPKSAGTPVTGFQESPKGEVVAPTQGPAVGNSRRGIR